MTMVALLGNPVKIASPLPRVTPNKLSQMLKEPTAMYLTPHPQKTPIFYPTVVLRDSPMDVSTTTATSNAYDVNDDNRCRTHSLIDDDNSTPDPPFFHDWDDSYKDLKLIIHLTGASIASTQVTHTDIIVPIGSIVAASDPPADVNPERTTFLKELDALHNKLFLSSTGASIVSTNETPTNTFVPAGSVVVASDPPAAAKPDYSTFLKELNALHNKLCIHSTGALLVCTQEIHADTIIPTGSIIEASDPTVAAKPDCTTFLKELNALHNKLPLMLLPRPFLPHTTNATDTPITVTMNNDQDPTIIISNAHKSNKTHHKKDHPNDHIYAHHLHNKHASNNRVNEISDHAEHPTDDRRHGDHQHDDKNKINAMVYAANDNKTCDNDGCTQPLFLMWHSQQYTLTFPTIGHATHNQHKRQPNSMPLAMKQRKVGTITTDNKSDMTLVQMWILLEQLKEINIQFAQWLNTLNIETPTTTPKNTPGNPMNPLAAPNATTPTILQSIPSPHKKHQAYTFFATHVNDPIGGMFLLLLPPDRHLPNVCIPPWPSIVTNKRPKPSPSLELCTGHKPDFYPRCLSLPTPATPTQSHMAIPHP